MAFCFDTVSFAQVHPPCIYIKTSSKTQEHGTRFYVPELLVLEEVRSVVLLFMCFSFETLLSCSYFKASNDTFILCMFMFLCVSSLPDVCLCFLDLCSLCYVLTLPDGDTEYSVILNE